MAHRPGDFEGHDGRPASLLREQAGHLGVSLTADQLDQLERYLALLLRWNARINLTRIVDPAAVRALHFLDSLAVLPHLPARAARLVDVGSGAGFPGAVVALARPDLEVVLVESVQKKAAFLEALKRELGLGRVSVRAVRLERLGEAGAFDVAVSRATFAPGEWIGRAAPFVRPGGRILAMLGRERTPLGAPPGWQPVRVVEYTLPVEGARALAIVDAPPP